MKRPAAWTGWTRSRRRRLAKTSTGFTVATPRALCWLTQEEKVGGGRSGVRNEALL